MGKMVKVGVVVDNEYHRDVRVTREVNMLDRLGYRPYVLCFSFSKTSESPNGNVHITKIRIPRKIKDFLYLTMNVFPIYEWLWCYYISRFIRKNKLSLVHTHDLYMSKAAKIGIRKSGFNIPLILDLHENYPHAILSYKWTQGYFRTILSQPKKWKEKEGRYLSYADWIIVLSENFRASLLERYNNLSGDQILVLPNVVDTQQFDQFMIDSIENLTFLSKPRILYFGMVAERRGIFETLMVCSELIREGENFSLLIIGPVDAADKARFSKEIANSIFDERLLYIPWIELAELPSYLNACDIALAPFEKNEQHESGVANKIFQYMYGKLPIVASNCKPQQELIEYYKIGEVFSTIEEFKIKLQKLINSRELREKMGKKALEVLNEEFSHKAMKKLLKDFYVKVLDN